MSSLAPPFFLDGSPVEWGISRTRVPYDLAVDVMEERIAGIHAGSQPEFVWLLEHPPLYTAGTSARETDLLNPQFPVYRSARGGQYTYHGPGQRVCYVMLDLNRRRRDVRAFVTALETWITDTLDAFNVRGERRVGRVGVWVNRSEPGGPLREDKIAAIGIRLRKWVSFHGIALNVEPNLSHFSGIVPCGIREAGLGVTSLIDLGLPVTMAEVDFALQDCFVKQFGTVRLVDEPKIPDHDANAGQ